ncbi:DUF6531 domain-containing protein [uncultured Xanthomonas sp.]|uniref:DUF6531 domain-containing protein n=1 Tax=uncultured Xanthomonas sp. TaxID=152831 RepID=UPI0025EDE05B|nr:DUF6531 domain-containing protein [uncultured Xanthomonas sp.]
MVAVFTGNGLGLFDSSLSKLGAANGGAAGLGRGQDRQFINVANGNLVLQGRDEFLNFRGLPISMVRTYNSFGQVSDTGNDGWVTGFERRVELVGTLGASDSKVRLQMGDGQSVDFLYDADSQTYQTTAGSGAKDSIAWDASAKTWTYTEGSTRQQEVYADHADGQLRGRLLKIVSSTTDAAAPAEFDLVYDSAGHVTEVRAANGTQTGDAMLFAYDAQGRLTGLSTRESGVVLTQAAYEYDALGRLTAVVTDLTPGDATDNTWDATNLASNDGLRFRTEYTYAGDSLRIASVRQSDGFLVSYDYYADGKVKSVVYGAGDQAQKTSFSYDASTLTTQVTDGNGQSWSYQYDSAGRLVQQAGPAVDGLRDLTTYSYDAAGNLLQSKQTRGGEVLARVDNLYDNRGNRLWQWDGEGRGTHRVYSATNQILSETTYTQVDVGRTGMSEDSASSKTTYVYDERDRVRFVVNSYGGVTEIQYATSGNGIGQKSAVITYNGGNGFAQYTGSLASPTVADLAQWAQDHKAIGNATTYAYDARGQLVQTLQYQNVDTSGSAVLDPFTRITRYTYDAQGLLRQQVVVHSSNMTADPETPIGAAAEITDYVYDGMGRLLSTLRRGSAATADLAKSDPAAYDAMTLQTTYFYADSAHQTRVTSDAGLVTTTTRNDQGQVISTSEAGLSNGVVETHVTQNFFDALGRLRATQDPTGARQYFFYDAKGRLAATVDATGAVTVNGYDGADQRTSSTAYANRVDTSQWLSDGKVVPQQLDQIGIVADAESDRTTHSSYDDSGLLINQIDGDGKVLSYQYDGKRNLIRMTQGAGDDARVTRYFYDALGNLEGTLDAEGYLVRRINTYYGQTIHEIRHATKVDPALREKELMSELIPQSSSADQKTTYFYAGRDILVGVMDSEGYVKRITEAPYSNSVYTQISRIPIDEIYRESNFSDTWAAVLDSPVPTNSKITLFKEYRNQLGQLTSVERNNTNQLPRRVKENYIYDDAGRLKSIGFQDNVGESRLWLKQYDAFGNVIVELDARGASWLQTDSSPESMQMVIDYLGTTNKYDAAGRLIETTAPGGAKTWYFRDANGRLRYTVSGVADAAGVANAQGEVVELRYDAFGDVSEKIAYGQRVTLQTPGSRDSASQALGVLSYVASRDVHQTWSYSKAGKVLSQVDALGTLTRYQYNQFGELVDTQKASGTALETTTHTTYDKRGLLTSQVEDAGTGKLNLTKTFQYDAFGRVVAEVDPRGNTVSHRYDRLGREVATTRVVNGVGATTTIAYDGLARITRQTDPMGNVTTYVYDDTINSVKATSAEGRVTETRRDSQGRIVSVTGVDNHSYTYDEDGRVISDNDPKLGEITYTYDGRGRLTQQQGRGKTIAYSYDDLGRLTQTTVDPTNGSGGSDHLALTTSYSYDALGRNVRTVDASGRVTAMQYDAAGNLLETIQDPDGLALRTTYTWDALGRQLSVTQGAGTSDARTTAYAYDAAGRRVSETIAPGSLDLVTTYSYDSNGNVVAKTDPAGRVQRFVYDEANHVVFAVDAAGGVVRNYYDAAGRVVASRRYAQAIDLSDASLAVNFAYVDGKVQRNDARDIQTFNVFGKDGYLNYTVDGVGAVRSFKYDAAGRLFKTRDLANAVSLSDDLRAKLQSGVADASALGLVENDAKDKITWSVYDGNGRLAYTIDAAGAFSQYLYDTAGRVKAFRQFDNKFPPDNALDGHTEAGTQYASYRKFFDSGKADVATLSNIFYWKGYDWEGRFKESTYHYDGAGRIKYEVNKVGASSDGGGGVVEYVYDGAGNVVEKVEYGKILSPIGGMPTFAEWDNEKILSSINGSNWNDLPASPDRHTYVLFDTAGRKVYTIDAGGRIEQSIYNGAGDVVELRTFSIKNGAVPGTTESLTAALQGVDFVTNKVQYDAAGRAVAKTDGLNHSELLTYDGAGLVTSRQDRNGNVWTYQYDAAGRRIAEIAPPTEVASASKDGSVSTVRRAIVTRTFYDAQGNVIARYEDADGGSPRITRYEYDNRGNQIRTIFPDAGVLQADGTIAPSGIHPTVEVTYDAMGRAVMQKDVRGNYTYKAYDERGLLVYDVDQNGGVTGYDYDALGNQVVLTRFANTIALPVGQVASGFDIASRITVSADLDRTVYTEYNMGGYKANVFTLPAGTHPQTDGKDSYTDGLNFRSAQYNAATRTAYRYDVFGNLVKQSVLLRRDPELQAYDPELGWGFWLTSYNYYDGDNRKIASVDAERYLTTYAYSAKGELIEQVEYTQPVQEEISLAHPPAPATPVEGMTVWNRRTTWTYDAAGRKISESVDRYLPQGSPADIGATQAPSSVSTFAYDAEGHLQQSTVNGATVNMTYDASGKVTSTKEGARNVVATGAGSALATGNFVDLDDAALYQSASPYTRMWYDAFGNLVQSRAYALGLRAGDTAPQESSADALQSFGYDRQGRNVWERTASGAVKTRTFDAADRVLSETYRLDGNDGRWADIATSYTYDAVGRQLTTQTARQNFVGGAAVGVQIDASEQVQYNSFGEIAHKRSAIGASNQAADYAEHYTYDAYGRLLSSNAGDGVVRTYSYDAAGRQISEQHAVTPASGSATLVVTTVNTFDNLGRMIRQDRPGLDAGTTVSTSQSYDRSGNVVSSTDARGATTYYDYNELNQVVFEARPGVRVVSASGEETMRWPQTSWYYDAAGRLIATRDANGNVRRYEYENGLLKRQIDGTGSVIKFAYDALGRQILAQDPMGRITRRDYNGAGQIVAFSDTTAGGNSHTWAPLERHTLDQNGNRLTVTDAQGKTVSNDYDSKGRLLRTQSAEGVAMAYAYDVHGNKIRETNALADFSLAGGSGGSASITDRDGEQVRLNEQTWDYDYFNRVVDHNDLSGDDYNYVYDTASGQLLSQSVDNGQGQTTQTATTQSASGSDGQDNDPPAPPTTVSTQGTRNYKYAANGLLLEVSEQTSSGTTNRTRYDYDANGNRTLEETQATDVSGRPLHLRTIITYDAHNRIEGIVQDDLVDGRRMLDTRYSYDAVGNRRRIEVGSFYNPAGEQPLNASFEDGDRNWILGESWSIRQETDGGQAHTGTWGARFDGTRNGPQSITNKKRIAVLPGQTATASVQVQQGGSSAGDAAARVLIIWYDADGNMLPGGEDKSWSGGNLVDSGSNGEWKKSSVTVKVPPGAAYMGIGASAKKNPGAALNVDDFTWGLTSDSTASTLPTQTYWYDYDAENRVTVSNGALVNGQIVASTEDVSFAQNYDAAGNVATRSFYDNGTLKRQQMIYDARGHLTQVLQQMPDNVWRVLETSSYDGNGRVLERRTYDDSGAPKHIDVSQYDGDGRLIAQQAYGRPLNDSGDGSAPADGYEGLTLLSTVTYQQQGDDSIGYDTAGRLRGYRYTLLHNEKGSGVSSDEGYTHTYRNSYLGRDSYLQQVVSGSSSNSKFKTSNSTSSYDDWGRLLAVREQTPGSKIDDRVRYFGLDQDGNILRRTEGTIKNGVFTQDDAAVLRTQVYAYVNGQNVASGRYDGKVDVLGRTTAYDVNETGTTKATVQAGDTLRSLAQRLYGNANLWYVLADANALEDDSGLVAGATLTVPDVTSAANDAHTFKPFNTSEAVGSTSPALPYIQPPSSHGCGSLATIIMVAVAVVVTVYTAGAAGAALGSAATATTGTATVAAGATAAGTAASVGTFTAGAGVLAGTYGTTAAIVGGAAGALAGSVASQGVGSAMGATSFSWRNVAASTVAGAVTAGFGAATSGAAALSNPVVQAMATGAVGNLSTYAANQLVGNDVGFSWRSVAASVVSAGITAKLAPSLTGFLDPTSSAAQFQAGLIRGIAGGIVSAHVRRELIGGDVDYQNVLADAFGNVLGEALSGEYAQRATEAGSMLGTRTAYVGAGTDDRNLFAGVGGGPGSPYPEDLRARITGDGDAGTRIEPDTGIEAMAQDIRARESRGEDMSKAWELLDEYRQRTYAGNATTVATTNDNITTLETVQVRPDFADTAELWRQQAASYDAVGSFISQLAQNGRGSVPDYAGAATAWVQAPKQYELDYFRQHGTAMPAVSDSGAAMREAARQAQGWAAIDANRENLSSAIAGLTARGLGADPDKANEAALRTAEYTQPIWDIADVAMVRLNIGRQRAITRSASVRVRPAAPTRTFNNRFPEDVPRAPNVIPNEMLPKISQRNLAYVVKEDGTLIVGRNNQFQGHIDLAGGDPVLAAGELSIHAGRLKYIDNNSGHYRPSGIYAQRAAEDAFRRIGFDVEGKYIERSFND